MQFDVSINLRGQYGSQVISIIDNRSIIEFPDDAKLDQMSVAELDQLSHVVEERMGYVRMELRRQLGIVHQRRVDFEDAKLIKESANVSSINDDTPSPWAS